MLGTRIVGGGLREVLAASSRERVHFRFVAGSEAFVPAARFLPAFIDEFEGSSIMKQ
jgi:hypothetical protein